MPVRLKWKDKGVVFIHQDAVTADEISRANSDFFGDDRSDRVRYQIIDFLGMTSIQATEMDMKMVAAHDIGSSSYLKAIRMAFVTDNPDFIKVTEAYRTTIHKLSSDWCCEIFPDRETAEEWAQA